MLHKASLQVHISMADEDDYDKTDDPNKRREKKRFWLCLLFTFVLAFIIFCLIFGGVSKSFSPIVTLKGMIIESLNIQSGYIDGSGVNTDMLTLNSTVRIVYQNPSTFFTLHVTSSPIHLNYTQLILASGQIAKFSQRRKSKRIIKIKVVGYQIPLYGGVPALYGQRLKPDQVVLPLNLTFALRSRAYVLGRLVKAKFYTNIRCNVTFHGDRLGKRLNLSKSCFDHWPK